MSVTPSLTISHLDSVPIRNSEREEEVFNTLHALGCDVSLQNLPHGRGANVICTITGESDEEILIAAHHDRLGSGRGVADNWTGITILLDLATHYLKHPPIHTIRLVAFADEENDMRGSYHYVRQLKRGRGTRPRVMVNIDTVGVGALRLDYRSSPELACVARAVGDTHDVPLPSPRLSNMAGDWEPFMAKGIPVLHFHSLDDRSMGMLHTYRDRRDLVNDRRLSQALGIIAGTISALDHGIDLTLSVD
jgi:Zn-dependent M28 family amino/carboxypeptidase